MGLIQMVIESLCTVMYLEVGFGGPSAFKEGFEVCLGVKFM